MAVQELAQAKNEDPLPLRKAKLTQGMLLLLLLLLLLLSIFYVKSFFFAVFFALAIGSIFSPYHTPFMSV
jgi:predicted PurR-regulated permease PerM